MSDVDAEEAEDQVTDVVPEVKQPVGDESDDGEDLAERVKVLEQENLKLKSDIEDLKSRVECLEASEEQVEVVEKKSSKGSKKIGKGKKDAHGKGKKDAHSKGKKDPKKKKNAGKKGHKLKPKEEVKRTSIRDRAKTDFYTFCGKRMYIAVPEPFKFGSKQGPPEKELRLNWAYGYNGSCPARNLVTLGNKLVYGLAGICVVYDPEEKKQSFFIGHSEDVTCLASNPEHQLIASGQRDPKDGIGEEDKPYVCIWNVDGKEEKRIRNACEKSVVSVGFTFDGRYIFVIGDDDQKTGSFFEWNKSATKAIFSMMCSKDIVSGQSHNHVKRDDRYNWFTFGNKIIKFWSVDPEGKSHEEKVKVNSPETYNITKISQKCYNCATFDKDGLHAFIGCQSGHVYYIGLKHLKLIKFFAPGKHAIKSIYWFKDKSDEHESDERPEGSTYRVIDSVGGTVFYDDKHKKVSEVKLKIKRISYCVDINNTTYIGTKKASLHAVQFTSPEDCKTIVHGHTDEIWCLATHPDKPWVCIGSEDKKLRIWDWNDKVIKYEKSEKTGMRCSDFSRDGKFLAIGCYDGSVKVMNMDDGEYVYDKKICKEEVAAIAFSAAGDKIVLGSWDQTVRVLSVNKWKLKTMNGHTSSITHIGISEDGSLAQSDSKDCEKLFWDLKKNKRIDEIPFDTIWDRWNCIFGWPVQGLYHRAGTSDDVNCCDISGGNALDDEKGTKIVASGNDTGHVTLYKYPVLEEEPKFKEYLAHSAHVTNTRFSPDSEWLFTSGGGDLAVLQWNVLECN